MVVSKYLTTARRWYERSNGCITLPGSGYSEHNSIKHFLRIKPTLSLASEPIDVLTRGGLGPNIKIRSRFHILAIFR